MKASKELINHISSSLWNVSQAQIESVLNGFEGNPIEETPKHLIELVNERYPNGWCVKTPCEEVLNDIKKVSYITNIYDNRVTYIGWTGEANEYNGYEGWYGINSPKSTIIEITKSEYLSITRPKKATPPQRDWTGVRFKMASGNEYIIEKSGFGYTTFSTYTYFTHNEVNDNFSNGTWIEIPNEEQPTIHAEKPRDPLNLFDMEKRLKAAEDTIDVLSRDKENLWNAIKTLEAQTEKNRHEIIYINQILEQPQIKDLYLRDSGDYTTTVKRNHDIEDWKTVECLSYEDVIKIVKDCGMDFLDLQNDEDLARLKNFIKQKLNK